MPHVEVPQAEFKLVILGDANCGKTSLITRFTQGYYRYNSPKSSIHHPTFVTKSIPVTSFNIPTKIQIWDVAGPNNNTNNNNNDAAQANKGAHTAAKCYYSTSSAILLGYDVTSRSSYEGMRLWLNELRKSVPFHVVVVAIVALKTDLLQHYNHQQQEEMVPEYEVEQLAQALNVMYVPTSSKLDVNVTSLFQRVAEEVLERRKRGVVVGQQSYNGRNHYPNGLGVGGMNERYHSSVNNDIMRPSSPLSSKDLYGNDNNNNNNNMGGRGGGGGGGGGPSHNLNSHNNNFGYGGDIQPYMGEESVLREYQALIQKQQELDARLANAKVMMSQQQHQGNNNNGGGGGMMSSPYNTNNMGGMMGGRGGNHYGNQQQQQFMQDAPQSMSPNNPNPNAARDYMNRLRMMRQGNNIDIPFQYNNNGMPENVQSSSGGMANMGNMNNMGGGGGGGGNMNNMGGNNGMNNMGGGNMGGVNSQKEFNLEDYQASLQEFLGHDDGNKNNGSGGQVRRQHSMASQATQNFNNTSNAAYAAAGGGGSAEVLKVPTNLHDGNRRSAARRNSDRSIDDIDLPIGRNTFKSVDSDDRPSFQSIDDVGIGGIRDTFRSVDTMDLMSIGASLNEIVEEDIKQNESEQRKKNSRRLSATSIHSRYARGALGGGGATLSDYAQLPGATVDVKTMSHGQGGGGGPKKIKKAIDPRLVALAGRESAARGTKSSMLSQDLNLEGIDDAERMSFGGLSIMSGLTDFGDDIDVANVKGLGGNIEE
mmetsp:Transcript_20035/g.32941  ORF Transcript_20035/g.32941 Transcript_20035/m.32941 type:complete len:761 (+) Transcript_20035:128-2410(+)